MSLLPSLFERKMPSRFEDLFEIFTESQGGWGSMKVDVRETPTEYLIKADLPGFEKNQVDVSLTNQLLTISAEREEKEDEKEGEYLVQERRIFSMQRAIPLSGAGAPEQVKAELKEGVLCVRVKKSPDKQAKRIQVQ